MGDVWVQNSDIQPALTSPRTLGRLFSVDDQCNTIQHIPLPSLCTTSLSVGLECHAVRLSKPVSPVACLLRAQYALRLVCHLKPVGGHSLQSSDWPDRTISVFAGRLHYHASSFSSLHTHIFSLLILPYIRGIPLRQLFIPSVQLLPAHKPLVENIHLLSPLAISFSSIDLSLSKFRFPFP